MLTLVGALLAAFTWSMSTTAILTSAPVALIMGGTGTPDPDQQPGYIPNVQTYYIDQFSSCTFAAACDPISVHTPEQFWPVFGGPSALTFDQSVAQGVIDLDGVLHTEMNSADPPSKIVIFGYSQSGTITTLELRNLQANPATAPPAGQLEAVIIGDPNRPNGGILARAPGLVIPILGVTFSGPIPTDTGYRVTDISFQYDGISDTPQYPIDLLADLNALAGYVYEHSSYPSNNPYGYTPDQLIAAMNDPANQEQYNANTLFVTIPAKNLPVLQPIRDLATSIGVGFLATPILDLLQPTLRTLVELGYDRTIPYGQPTTIGLIPLVNPVTLGLSLVGSAFAGVGAALNDVVGELAPAATTPAPATTNSPIDNLNLAVNKMNTNVASAQTPNINLLSPKQTQLTSTSPSTLTPKKPEKQNLVRASSDFSPHATKPKETSTSSSTTTTKAAATATPTVADTTPAASTKTDATKATSKTNPQSASTADASH
ncbi:MAG TPA: PE-PPE domain-containing protein [Mycobacterium sp.]|nr:PE-PPE domain-containing protein [Mycobacterium sp.]